MKCSKLFGTHDWSAWDTSLTAPRKLDDGNVYRQRMQSRACEWCGYRQQEWLNSWDLVEVTPDENTDEDRQVQDE